MKPDHKVHRQDISKPQYDGETSVNIRPAVIYKRWLHNSSAALKSLTVFGMKDLQKLLSFNLWMKKLLQAPTGWC